jgi:hypothetical protein
LDPRKAAAERFAHEAESNPKSAVRKANLLLAKGRDSHLLRAVAAAYSLNGDHHQARVFAAEAQLLGAHGPSINQVTLRVCAALQDQSCMTKASRRIDAIGVAAALKLAAERDARNLTERRGSSKPGSGGKDARR